MSYQTHYALRITFEHRGGYVVPKPDRIVFGRSALTSWDESPEINCTFSLNIAAAPHLADAFDADFAINLDVSSIMTVTDSFAVDFEMTSTALARMTLTDISIHLNSAPVENIELILDNVYDSISAKSINAIGNIDFEIIDIVYGQYTGEILCDITCIVTKQIITIEPPVILLPPSCTLDFFSVWKYMEGQRNRFIIKYNESLGLTKKANFVYNKNIQHSKKLLVVLGYLIQQNKNTTAKWQAFGNLFNIDLLSIISGNTLFNNNTKVIYNKHSDCESIGYLIKYLNSINLKKVFVVPFTTKKIVDVGVGVVRWGYCATSLYKIFKVFYQQRCYSGNDFIFPYLPPVPPGPTTLILPIKDCYLMTCTTSVKLYPEMIEIEANSVSLNIDDDSFAWKVSFDLFYATDAEALIPAAGYKEVLITVCGHLFLCVIESVSRQDSFNGSTFRASGRSISAYLTSPYVSERDYIQSSDLSVVQIAEEELTGFTGWSIDWQSEADFFVPNGTFKYSNKTPLQAIRYIAEGVGAFIQTDKLNKIISVIPNYPYSPWTWPSQTPDAFVPINVITNESITKTTVPLYERVYCIGEDNGILMQVTRNGTAGAILHSQFLHPLICDTASGIEAGRAILSKRGDSWTHSLEMPLFHISEQPTLMLPGHLIEVQRIDLSTWIGQCSSVSIKSNFAGNTIQIIEIEKRNV